MDLLKIESPAFIKVLTLKELEGLAGDIREFMIDSIFRTGGQLFDNLSTVELTIGLHKVFNSPADKIVFDASNQAYTHKILTGRANDFRTLRQVDGLSGYQSNVESIHDPYLANEKGQGLSIGYGLSMYNDARQVVVVINQEVLSYGQVYEALNHISSSDKKMIIIINDNDASSKLKPISTSLKNLMVAKPITQIRDDMSQFFDKGNLITAPLKRGIRSLTSNLSKTVTTSNIFTELGLRYAGPFDGHSIRDIVRVLNYAASSNENIVIHFKTEKGKGYQPAHNEKDGLWVGLNPFDLKTGQQIVEKPQGYQSDDVMMVDYALELARHRPETVVVNASSALSALYDFKEGYDVSDYPSHGLSFVSGLSLSGLKPIVLVEASQLVNNSSRLLNEIGGMNLNMTLIDLYTGLNMIEGSIQSSLFDYPLLSIVPHVIVAQGKNTLENCQLFELSINQNNPMVIRVENHVNPEIQYPVVANFEIGDWELIKHDFEKPKAVVFMSGPNIEMVSEKVVSNNLPIWIVNCRFLNHLDESLMFYLKEYEVPFVTLMQEYEFGSLQKDIQKFMNVHQYTQSLIEIGLPKTFVGHGSPAAIKKRRFVDSQSLLNQILEAIKE